MDPSQQTPQQSAQDPRAQVIERLGQANHVLVTVRNNPTVDQLSACIGATLMLNKLGKHATAVFSGNVPSTIEFLQPEKTIEKNTDSLRDFIIALDKSKADKLRYKIEDKFVKIFITPYRTSLSEKDLEFSQGDYNVDVVLALGVHRREELDQAITAHGRILHDATVICVNTDNGNDIGAINWRDPKASSLSEMLVDLGESLKSGLLDAQIATAFLTGIVAETNRFSNERTSAQTMNIAAKLINAGANQQLIATKLEPPKPPLSPPPPNISPKDMGGPKSSGDTAAELPKPEDGSLQIPHDETSPELTAEPPEMPENQLEQIYIDEQGTLRREAELAREKKQKEKSRKQETSTNSSSRMVLEPPSMGGTLTANTRPEPLEPSTDPLSAPTTGQHVLSTVQSGQKGTLEDIEKSVASPHLDNAREAVNKAVSNSEPQRLGPIAALNAQPVGLDLHPPSIEDQENRPSGAPTPRPSDSSAPPPVPPPLMPPSV